MMIKRPRPPPTTSNLPLTLTPKRCTPTALKSPPPTSLKFLYNLKAVLGRPRERHGEPDQKATVGRTAEPAPHLTVTGDPVLR